MSKHCQNFTFAPLPPHNFDLAVVDPPWHFRLYSEVTGAKKSAQAHYPVMSLADIKTLPVRELLKDDAVVFTWATGAMLPQAFEAMTAWGVIYKSSLVWRKVTRAGKVRVGCGFWARTMHEHVLLGTIGKPRCFAMPSLFDGIAREHSRKPDEFYRMIAERTPGWRRVDIFAREMRQEWACWGDEIERFGDGNAPPELQCYAAKGRSGSVAT
jgi:N6-adenosine-specific RNA methylase IME4